MTSGATLRRTVAGIVAGLTLAGTGAATAGAAPAAPAAAPTTAGTIARAGVAADAFTDIATNPFRADINWLAGQEVTSGWRVGTSYVYKPTEAIYRDQMAAFVYRMDGRPGYDLDAQAFADVAPTRVFAKEINYMFDAGYSTGYVVNGVRTYHPSEAITRGQFAAFLYRMEGVVGYTAPTTSPFKDLKPGDPFYTQICWLAELGITKGWPVTGGYEFRANEVVRRDTMAAFIHRYFTVSPTVGGGSPRLLRSTWVSLDLIDTINSYRIDAGVADLTPSMNGFMNSLNWAGGMITSGTLSDNPDAPKDFAAKNNLAGKPDGDSIRSAISLTQAWAADPAKAEVMKRTDYAFLGPGAARDVNGVWWSSVGLWETEPPAPAAGAASVRSKQAKITAKVQRLQSLIGD